MRIPLVAIAFAALSLSTIGAHADGTWCAYYGNKTNCGFYSFGQCRATVSGSSGFCQRNAADRTHWELLVVPLLWCAISGATLWAMQSPNALLAPAAALLAFVLACWKTLSRL